MTFVTYKKVFDKEELSVFLELLDKNAIPYEVEDVLRNFNPTMTPRDGSVELWVKILPEDFEKVKTLETQFILPYLETVEADYYLFSFNTGELKELLRNNTEWSLFDVLLAEKIIKDRGVDISEKEIENLKKETLLELSEEKSLDVFQLIIAYGVSVIIPFLGLIVGYFYYSHKKPLPSGEIFYVYNKQSRFNGKIIAFIGLLQLIFILIRLLFFIN